VRSAHRPGPFPEIILFWCSFWDFVSKASSCITKTTDSSVAPGPIPLTLPLTKRVKHRLRFIYQLRHKTPRHCVLGNSKKPNSKSANRFSKSFTQPALPRGVPTAGSSQTILNTTLATTSTCVPARTFNASIKLPAHDTNINQCAQKSS
jgi:hypothetical protein